MIDTQNGFDLSCTTCPRTNRPCAAGVSLARQLAKAVSAAGASVADDFEVTGHGKLDGCCDGDCGVVYRLNKARFGVFCGVPEDTDAGALMAVAAGFLRTGPVSAGPVPRAMVFAERQAVRIEPAYAC